MELKTKNKFDSKNIIGEVDAENKAACSIKSGVWRSGLENGII